MTIAILGAKNNMKNPIAGLMSVSQKHATSNLSMNGRLAACFKTMDRFSGVSAKEKSLYKGQEFSLNPVKTINLVLAGGPKTFVISQLYLFVFQSGSGGFAKLCEAHEVIELSFRHSQIYSILLGGVSPSLSTSIILYLTLGGAALIPMVEPLVISMRTTEIYQS